MFGGYNYHDLFSLFLKATLIVGISWSFLILIVNFQLVKNSILWKLFDYLWFGAAAVGIFSLCVTFDRYTSEKIYKTYYVPEIKRQYQSLYDSFKVGETKYCELVSISTTLKPTPKIDPSEFDDPISIFHLCKYFQHTFSNMPNPSSLQGAYKKASEMNIFPYEWLLENQCYDRIESQAYSQIYYYDEILENAEKLQNGMELPNYYPNIQWILKIFGVLLGFRLSKVTAELKDICKEQKISSFSFQKKALFNRGLRILRLSKIIIKLNEIDIKKKMSSFISNLVDSNKYIFSFTMLCLLSYIIYFL